MRWRTRARTVDTRMQWHLWFAWYPVKLPDGKWVWLEKVYRQLIWASYGLEFQYRNKD